MNSPSPAVIEPDPIEIESETSGDSVAEYSATERIGQDGLCGCAIEDLETLIYLRAAELVEQWERADPRDCWRHTGERPPRIAEPTRRQELYRPADSTVSAFWYVVGLNDLEYLKAWLANHPADAPI